MALQLDGAAKRLAGGVKDAERLVAAKLDHLAAGRRHRLAGELGEPGREPAGLLVAVRLREGRVAADVRDQERADDGLWLDSLGPVGVVDRRSLCGGLCGYTRDVGRAILGLAAALALGGVSAGAAPVRVAATVSPVEQLIGSCPTAAEVAQINAASR